MRTTISLIFRYEPSSHPWGAHSCYITLRLKSQQVTNSKSNFFAIKRYFSSTVVRRVANTSCRCAKDKARGDLLAAFGLVVSLLCHFRLCNNFIFSFCFLVCLCLYPKTSKNSCRVFCLKRWEIIPALMCLTRV
jgi:hypothetical protein